MALTTRSVKGGITKPGLNIACQVVGKGKLGLVCVPGWISHLEESWEEPSLARFLQRRSSFSSLILGMPSLSCASLRESWDARRRPTGAATPRAGRKPSSQACCVLGLTSRFPRSASSRSARTTPPMGAPLLGAGFSPLVDGDVGHFKTLTLLVTVEQSPRLLRRTLTGKLESLLPNVERVESPNAAHLMHEQNPKGFNQAVQPSSAAMRLSPA